MQVDVRDAGSILLPRERQGQRSRVAPVHGVAQLDTTTVAEYPRWHL